MRSITVAVLLCLALGGAAFSWQESEEPEGVAPEFIQYYPNPYHVPRVGRFHIIPFYVAHGGYGAMIKDTSGDTLVQPIFLRYGDQRGTPLYSIDFTTAGTVGYAVGWRGTIIKTTDGGNKDTWYDKWSGTYKDLYSVHFPLNNTDSGYVVGSDGLLLKTTTGGDTWNAISIGANETLYGIRFLFNGPGVIVGSSGAIFRTVNGSDQAWTRVSSGTTESLRSLCFDEWGKRGFSVGANGTILTTRDSGATWSKVTPPPTSYDLYSVWYGGGAVVYAVGERATVLKSSDTGATWTVQQVGAISTQNLLSVDFCNSNIGFASGTWGAIVKTVDGGATWNKLTGLSGNYHVYSIQHYRDQTGRYVLMSGGTESPSTRSQDFWENGWGWTNHQKAPWGDFAPTIPQYFAAVTRHSALGDSLLFEVDTVLFDTYAGAPDSAYIIPNAPDPKWVKDAGGNSSQADFAIELAHKTLQYLEKHDNFQFSRYATGDTLFMAMITPNSSGGVSGILNELHGNVHVIVDFRASTGGYGANNRAWLLYTCIHEFLHTWCPDQEHDWDRAFHYGLGSFDGMNPGFTDESHLSYNVQPSLLNPVWRDELDWVPTTTVLSSSCTGRKLQFIHLADSTYTIGFPGTAQYFMISAHMRQLDSKYTANWPANPGLLVWHVRKRQTDLYSLSWLDPRVKPIDIECMHGQYEWDSTEVAPDTYRYFIKHPLPDSGRDSLDVRGVYDSTAILTGWGSQACMMWQPPAGNASFYAFSNPSSNLTDTTTTLTCIGQTLRSHLSVKFDSVKTDGIYVDVEMNRPITDVITALSVSPQRKIVYDKTARRYHVVYTSYSSDHDLGPCVYYTTQGPDKKWTPAIMIGRGESPAIALNHSNQPCIAWVNQHFQNTIEIYFKYKAGYFWSPTKMISLSDSPIYIVGFPALAVTWDGTKNTAHILIDIYPWDAGGTGGQPDPFEAPCVRRFWFDLPDMQDHHEKAASILWRSGQPEMAFYTSVDADYPQLNAFRLHLAYSDTGGVWYKTRTEAGPWTTGTIVYPAQSTKFNQAFIDIASDSVFIIAKKNVNMKGEVYCASKNLDSTWFGGIIRLSQAAPSGDADSPQISDGVYAIWQDLNVPHHIYTRVKNKNTGIWSDLQCEDTGPDPASPCIADLDPDGDSSYVYESGSQFPFFIESQLAFPVIQGGAGGSQDADVVPPIVVTIPSVAVLPNPSAGSFRLRCSGVPPEGLHLLVYNGCGQLVKETCILPRSKTGLAEIAWDGSDNDSRILPNGVYFCRFETRNSTGMTKLVIVR